MSQPHPGTEVSNTSPADTALVPSELHVPDESVDVLLAFDPDGDDPILVAADIARPMLVAEVLGLADRFDFVARYAPKDETSQAYSMVADVLRDRAAKLGGGA